MILPSAAAENASRTESVPTTITESGPAAASRPFLEAIESNEAVGGGRESLGHGDGNRRSFASPATAWNPIAYKSKVSNPVQPLQLRMLNTPPPCVLPPDLPLPVSAGCPNLLKVPRMMKG